MNKLLLSLLLCLVVVNARHYGEREDSETLSDDDSHTEFRKERQHSNQPRHRKRRWQNYRYDYQPPQYYSDRQDSFNSHQELLPQIYRLLEDLSSYVRRSQQTPPPPPQPVYIPYPVPYFVPRYVPCKPSVAKVNNTPSVDSRLKDLDDSNRNWGFVPINDIKDELYDDSDGARPISFDPIQPKQTNLRPVPSVEHGSSQGNVILTTQAPAFDIPPSVGMKLPSMCNAAILSCCSVADETQKKQCFTEIGCGKTYSKGNACNSNSIRNALEAIKDAYAPVN